MKLQHFRHSQPLFQKYPAVRQLQRVIAHLWVYRYRRLFNLKMVRCVFASLGKALYFVVTTTFFKLKQNKKRYFALKVASDVHHFFRKVAEAVKLE